MKDFRIDTSDEVSQKFNSYPSHVRPKLLALRNLILDTAVGIERIDRILETLKWGEPAYLAKKGITLRIDWKEKNPDRYAIYLQCTSKLIPTVKKVYGDIFKYEGTRALIFDLKEDIPETEVREVIQLALNYHLLKHKPYLGL